ncbi:MAG: hypothetical protein V3S11_06950 [Elusimicrobiota bacterium]
MTSSKKTVFTALALIVTAALCAQSVSASGAIAAVGKIKSPVGAYGSAAGVGIAAPSALSLGAQNRISPSLSSTLKTRTAPMSITLNTVGLSHVAQKAVVALPAQAAAVPGLSRKEAHGTKFAVSPTQSRNVTTALGHLKEGGKSVRKAAKSGNGAVASSLNRFYGQKIQSRGLTLAHEDSEAAESEPAFEGAPQEVTFEQERGFVLMAVQGFVDYAHQKMHEAGNQHDAAYTAEKQAEVFEGAIEAFWQLDPVDPQVAAMMQMFGQQAPPGPPAPVSEAATEKAKEVQAQVQRILLASARLPGAFTDAFVNSYIMETLNKFAGEAQKAESLDAMIEIASRYTDQAENPAPEAVDLSYVRTASVDKYVQQIAEQKQIQEVDPAGYVELLKDALRAYRLNEAQNAPSEAAFSASVHVLSKFNEIAAAAAGLAADMNEFGAMLQSQAMKPWAEALENAESLESLGAATTQAAVEVITALPAVAEMNYAYGVSGKVMGLINELAAENQWNPETLTAMEFAAGMRTALDRVRAQDEGAPSAEAHEVGVFVFEQNLRIIEAAAAKVDTYAEFTQSEAIGAASQVFGQAVSQATTLAELRAAAQTAADEAVALIADFQATEAPAPEEGTES